MNSVLSDAGGCHCVIDFEKNKQKEREVIQIVSERDIGGDYLHLTLVIIVTNLTYKYV